MNVRNMDSLYSISKYEYFFLMHISYAAFSTHPTNIKTQAHKHARTHAYTHTRTPVLKLMGMHTCVRTVGRVGVGCLVHRVVAALHVGVGTTIATLGTHVAAYHTQESEYKQSIT